MLYILKHLIFSLIFIGLFWWFTSDREPQEDMGKEIQVRGQRAVEKAKEVGAELAEHPWAEKAGKELEKAGEKLSKKLLKE